MDDAPRSGRVKQVDDAAIIAVTLDPPPEKLGVTHWSTRLLADQLVAPIEVDTAQANYRAALAGVDVISKQLEDTVLRAPITGQIALWLMLVHALWATRVVRRKDEELRTRFHRYSLVVWCIWLVPYIGGMILGMRGS